MRVIKFRGWSEHHKKWYDRVLAGCTSDGADYICNLVWSDDHGDHGDWVNFDGQIVQYTGLKDKNGKEIYEGDILKTKHRRIVFGESSDGSFLNPSSEEYEKVGVIEHYLGHQFGYRLRWKKGHLMIDTTMMISNMKGEVIGNIYEHTHLLEARSANGTTESA